MFTQSKQMINMEERKFVAVKMKREEYKQLTDTQKALGIESEADTVRLLVKQGIKNMQSVIKNG